MHNKNKTKKQVTAKIVLLGNVGVGKSCISSRYIYNKFDSTHQTTLGAAFMDKTCTLHYKPDEIRSPISKRNNRQQQQGTTSQVYHLKLQIWDTAGQQKYKSIAKLYYKDCNVVIMVYSVVDMDSFNNLRFWYEDLTKHAPANIKIVLVGNKIDMLDQQPQKQVVSYKQAKTYAEQINAVLWEVSAKDNTGIEDMFQSVVEEVGPLLYRERVLGHRESLKGSFLEAGGQSGHKCCRGG